VRIKMRAPVDWLKEYVDIEESLESVAHKLTMAGLEVGEIAKERFGYENSFVASIIKVEDHPKKEGMFVLTVAGGDKERTVLTNLRRFEVGELIPVAYEGYIFPDGTKLEPMKFGGILSDAKIMSEWDIEYSDEKEVMLPLPGGAAVGQLIPDVLGITSDVFVFDLTSNRGDCLCILGIARELAAILGKEIKKNVYDISFEERKRDVEFSVEIKDVELCTRYSGRLIQEIKIEQSPIEMKRKLIACGMRPINGIVDVTNYVMLEVGQPLHAFDLDTLQNREIIVRRASAGESIVTIDGQDRPLSEDMLVIADSTRPVAVAGVMGGMQTEITSGTTNMLLESAYFNPRTIRRTASKLLMKSEASLRFEKGISVDTVVNCSDYAAYLIYKNGWGKPLSNLIDEYPGKKKPNEISVKTQKIRDFITPEIADETMVDALKRLGFDVKCNDGVMNVIVPGHRQDVVIWADLAEEVARIYGYENVTSVLPKITTKRAIIYPNLNENKKIREALIRCGLSEVITFSFTNEGELRKLNSETPPEAIKIRNPLTEDHTHLRPTLLISMLKTIAYNRKNTADEPLRFFELGKVFLNPSEPVEKDALVVAISGNAFQTPTKSDYKIDVSGYYAIKGIIDLFLEVITTKNVEYTKEEGNVLYHPGRCSIIEIDGVKIGVLGEVHPALCRNFDIKDKISLAEIDLAAVKKLLGEEPEYERISKLPSLTRDLSIIVDEKVLASSIAKVIRKKGTDLLKNVVTFDVFRGDIIGNGKKSVSFKLEFRHHEKTLTDSEVKPIVDEIILEIENNLGGKLREI